MSFTWPDPISFIADVVTIVGLPIIWLTFKGWLREWKYDREHNIASMDCIEFLDVDGRHGINLVPIKTLSVIPRVGEEVYLPGERQNGEQFSTGLYRVLSVRFIYGIAPEVRQPSPARPEKIVIQVRNITPIEWR